MLARVAESLYWIGRNIERYEHCSRYLKVQYFSTLDAPMSQNKDFTLRSILFMSGSDFDINSTVIENDVWRKVIFDSNNPNSLFRLVQNARENARSIRNNISTELWEAINKWFLFIKHLDSNRFTSSEIFWYSENATHHIALMKSLVATTLLHNDIWGFINLGMYVERGLQVLRILRSKISDSIILSNNGVNIPLLQYQWTTLLKSLEAFDVYRYQYKGILTKETIFELILDNEIFPRSLKFSTKKMFEHTNRISVKPPEFNNVIKNFADDIDVCLEFDDFSDEEKVLNNTTKAEECITTFHLGLQELYFN